MEVPLIPDVGWAVIDYLKCGRPKVDSSRIFVRHMAPFLPFAEGDHLDQLIKSYMVKAHIPVSGKHRGMHSLRHTMASVLLEKDTPLPVISDIIGPLDTNSTAVYLKVDMERLAECPLDFEEMIRLGCTYFYRPIPKGNTGFHLPQTVHWIQIQYRTRHTKAL